jgi:nucleoside-diphosphate kinase
MKSQLVGELLAAVRENGFEVGALFSVHMTLAMGEEFFEVYRTLLPEYIASLGHMCTTPVLAVMITGPGSVVQDFRDFVGPINPALARSLRPKSLRATFGDSLVTNAVHCTDLPEDGEMECRYFFETLASL